MLCNVSSWNFSPGVVNVFSWFVELTLHERHLCTNKQWCRPRAVFGDTFVASLVAQRLKRLPAMWETWIWSLGQEDPLEKEMATHSSIHAWRIPWTEEPGGVQSTGSQRVRHAWATSLSFFHFLCCFCNFGGKRHMVYEGFLEAVQWLLPCFAHPLVSFFPFIHSISHLLHHLSVLNLICFLLLLQITHILLSSPFSLPKLSSFRYF